jgi:hypothetical protein
MAGQAPAQRELPGARAQQTLRNARPRSACRPWLPPTMPAPAAGSSAPLAAIAGHRLRRSLAARLGCGAHPRPTGPPPARRPRDVRHAAVTLWMDAGLPPTEVARRACHSVAVPLKVYPAASTGKTQPPTSAFQPRPWWPRRGRRTNREAGSRADGRRSRARAHPGVHCSSQPSARQQVAPRCAAW